VSEVVLVEAMNRFIIGDADTNVSIAEPLVFRRSEYRSANEMALDGPADLRVGQDLDTYVRIRRDRRIGVIKLTVVRDI
jgi:hypothetical protein